MGIRLFCEEGIFDPKQPNFQGNNCLHSAATMGHVQVLKLLLASVPINDLNIGNNEGETPLHLACFHGREEATKLLVEQLETYLLGINETDKAGNTCFQVACNAFSLIKSHRSIKIVEFLLKRPDIDINSRINQNGDSVFHIACFLGIEELVKLLIDTPKFDINIENNEGLTGFHLACLQLKHNVIKSILNSGKVKIPEFKGIGIKFVMPCNLGRLDITPLPSDKTIITEHIRYNRTSVDWY